MNIFKLVKKNFILIIVILLILFTYRGWFRFGIIAGGDVRAWSKQSLDEFVGVFPAWENNEYGGFYTIKGLNLVRYPIKLMFGVLSNFGLNYSLSSRILIYFPFLILSFFGMKKLTSIYFHDRNLTAVISGLYLINLPIFFYSYILHLNSMLMSYALLPWIIYFFEKILSQKYYSMKNSLKLGLFFSFSCYYDLRIAYLTFMLLGLLLLFKLNKINLIKLIQLFNSGLIIILLNLFWILPLLKFPTNLVRTQDFLINSVSREVDLLNFFSSSYSYFNNYFFSILGIIVFIFAISNFLKKNNCTSQSNKLFYSYLCIFLVFGFLIKGIHPPFNSLFEFIFLKIPGFNSLRTTNKIYLVSFLSLTILIGSSLYSMKSKFKNYIYVSLLILSMISLIPLGIFNNYKPLKKVPSYINSALSSFIPKKNNLTSCYKKSLYFFKENLVSSNIFVLPTDPFYTTTTRNHSFTYTDDINREWEFNKKISSWRFSSYKGSILKENIPSYSNVFSLININAIMVLDSSDPWWSSATKGELEKALVMIDNIKKSDFIEKKLDDNCTIYINPIQTNRYEIKTHKFYVNNTDKFLNENFYFDSDNLYLLTNSSNMDSNISSNKLKPKISVLDAKKEYVHLYVENVDSQSYIQFNQRYNPYWYLVDSEENMVKSRETAINTNYFPLKKNGSYEVKLIFKPQKIITFGFWVWAISLLIIILYLVIKNEKNINHN